ncbi:MAG: hypothetical protein ACI8V4_001741, partial [Ilumatobacter sp.]
MSATDLPTLVGGDDHPIIGVPEFVSPSSVGEQRREVPAVAFGVQDRQPMSPSWIETDRRNRRQIIEVSL